MSKDLQEPLWTAQDVARYLNVSDKTVYDWAAIGFLPSVKLGDGKKSPVRFIPSEIKEWLEKRSSKGRTTRIPNKFLEAK